MKRSMILVVFVFLIGWGGVFPALTAELMTDVVINEIHYNPPDDNLESGDLREFIELFNPSNSRIDLSGYLFDNGITYTFPENTWIEPLSFVVLAKSTSSRYWSNRSFKIVGPYEGFLADGGERITLKHADGSIVESFKYSDDPLWPRGADGYNSSLERIAWDLPADDYHSWRSSERSAGTPGERNSVEEIPAYPVIQEYQTLPEHPTSSDSVQFQVTLDAPQLIQSAVLRYELLSDQPTESGLVSSNSQWKYWKGLSEPSEELQWTSITFDDSAWPTGQGGFGYGDLDRVNTVLSDMRGNYTTLYIRQTFEVDNPTTLGDLSLYIYYDDAFVCYINGEEVARSNAPQGYNHTSVSDSNYETESVAVFPLQLQRRLRVGTNVIALVGLNISLGNSSDFVLTPALISSGNAVSSDNRLAMQIVSQADDQVTLQATIPKTTSQNLVRANIEVSLVDGQSVILPHQIEPTPFLSYFVYDGEIESKLPILWVLEPKKSMLLDLSRSIGAAVCLPVGESNPTLFDGTIVLPSASNRTKLRFIKGAEFYGDRTINIIPEIPTGGTNAGISSPYREHLGFWFFREMGVLSPWSEFYRIVELPANPAAIQIQCLINQQVNEQFLAMNNRNPDADLYKLVYSNPNWEKHTNKEEGTASIEKLLQDLNVHNVQDRREAMDRSLVLEEFLAYSAASIYTSNWDGYWNNNWMYLDPDTQRWEMIPWDLDWIWGATPPPNTGPMYWQMPLQFPIDGVAVGYTAVSRARGPVTSPIHQDPAFYQDYLMTLRREFDRTFAEEKLDTKMDEMQDLLLADLDLIQQQTGRNVGQRKSQIQESYDTLKLYVERRRAYLDGLLPVPVMDWALY